MMATESSSTNWICATPMTPALISIWRSTTAKIPTRSPCARAKPRWNPGSFTMEARVALIVGAGSPFGQQVARNLAAAGLRVALNDLLPNHIEALAAELNAAGGQAAAYPTDLSRKLGLQTLLQAILETWEGIDGLVL